MNNNQSMQSWKKPLSEDIRSFSRKKYSWAFLLLLLALLGFVIPILPGFLFLLLAIALFKPGWMARIRKRLKELWKS